MSRLSLTSLFLLSACSGGPVQLIDEDGDGFYANDPDDRKVDCDDSPGRGENAFPGAPEVCDGLDNDCDGQTDEEDARDAVEFWPDKDEDGFGVRVDDPLIACSAPAGYSTNRRDCNDNDPTIFPNAPELCNNRDDNCNQQVDEGIDKAQEWYQDNDDDGFGSIRAGVGCKVQDDWVDNNLDCNDNNPDVYPGAVEICDGVDGDCDGLDDDADPDVVDGTVWWTDADRDGYGDILSEVIACGDSPTRADNPDDCNDNDAQVNPETIWYLDADNDGHGHASTTFGQARCTAPIGYVFTNDDCDDNDPDAWSGTRWYEDNDLDGYGAGSSVGNGCTYDPAWVSNADDCDDTRIDAFPGADEVCNNGLDDDCDGSADDDDPEGPIAPPTWYIDADGDSYGAFYTTLRQCAQPDGYADNRDDCNDKDPARGPGGTWYRDADRDGYGDVTDPCGQGCQLVAGCVLDATDCDDGDYDQNPGATWFHDEDEDGVGVGPSPIATGCLVDTTKRARLPGDCDDASPSEADPFCVGDGVADIVLTADIDGSGATGTVTVTCDGQATPVAFDAGDAGTASSIDIPGPVATGADCTLDLTGITGTATFELEACGEPLVTTTVGSAATEAVDVRCNGCNDIYALNVDPNLRVVTNATSCLYPQ